jgi:hypothetical protein
MEQKWLIVLRTQLHLLETVPTLLKKLSFPQTPVVEYLVRRALGNLPAQIGAIRLRSDYTVREFKCY